MSEGPVMMSRAPARWETATTLVMLLWVGASFAFVDNASRSLRYLTSLLDPAVIGALFLCAAVGTMIGTRWNWGLRRWALSLAAGAATTLALGFLSAVLVDLLQTGATPVAAAPAVYGFMAVQLVLQAGEPRR